ncbi:hypothetical protein BGX31_002336 [Mortierella sp. GBA43]|nr:hypothetical protein BGX31_002336 [Mortierella sp. GBA43]
MEIFSCTTVLAVFRSVVVGTIVTSTWFAIQFFKGRQIASETDPNIAPGRSATATIVLSSMILPFYLYTALTSRFWRREFSYAIPHLVMVVLGAANIVVSEVDSNTIYKVDDQDDELYHCIYPELCHFTTAIRFLACSLLFGTTAVDFILSRY